MYEHRRSRPLSRRKFTLRLIQHFLVAQMVVLGSLAIGMSGYMGLEGLPWRDAFLNAAMLLGGMGPVNTLHTEAGKLFAGIYALYAGLVFLVVTGILFAPVVHRFMHFFHWEQERG